MGFWKRLFGKKKIEEEKEDWDKIVYEHDKINFRDAEERKRYLTGCLEQMGEAEKEIALLTGEYALVTSHLTDMEEIEALPPEQMAEVKSVAGKLLTFDKERQRYLDKKERMSDSEYRKIRSQENEIEEGIKKLKEAEKYQKLVRQDLARLDGERNAYSYRRSELKTIMINLRGMAVICLAALVACILMLLILQFGFSMDAAIGYYVAVAAAAIAITVLFVKYIDAERDLGKVERSENKLILLQNKVKIRYVNNVNLLDYLYLKYEVESGAKLQKLWEKYLSEKEERRQYAEAEAKMDYYKKELVKLLSCYRVNDPDRFAAQPGALVDSREMIELRHGLIVRRQALRKQLEYNQNMAKTAKKEILDIAAQYPQYALEIREMVELAEKGRLL